MSFLTKDTQMGTKKIDIIYTHNVKYFKVWLISVSLSIALWVSPYFFGKYTDTTFPYITKEDILQELVGCVGTAEKGLEWCPVLSPHLQGWSGLLSSDVEVKSDVDIAEKNGIQEGGVWRPKECQSRYKVAIVIPYRNRSHNLQQFLTHMHPLLTRQQLNYRIVVVEHAGSAAFNRAKLFNIGFIETLQLEQFDCFIFHDVDLLPLDDRNIYACTHQPRHMYSAVDTFRYNLPYRSIFGGAIAMQRVHFEKINGFSNRFYGWGAEDDDMYDRLRSVGLSVIRFDPSVSAYIMLSHSSNRGSQTNLYSPQHYQGEQGSNRIQQDGLSSLSYQLLDRQMKKLFTWFLVSC